MFSNGKTGPAPVWLDIKNYTITFHLITLSEKLIVIENMRNKRMHTEPQNLIINGIEEKSM